jgi:hypothetical protein
MSTEPDEICNNNTSYSSSFDKIGVNNQQVKNVNMMGSNQWWRSIQVWIKLDLDLFGLIQTLQGTLAVHGAIFQTRRQVGTRLITNPLDQRSLIVHPWMHYSTGRSFETADF